MSRATRSGKKAIKNNERNYPVKKSIRLRKEKEAPIFHDCDPSAEICWCGPLDE